MEVLILNQNGLTDLGMSYLLRGVHAKRALESLNISQNQIGPKSIEALTEIFESSSRNYFIQELRMSELQFVGRATVDHLLTAFNESSFNGLLALKLTDLKLFDNILEKQ